MADGRKSVEAERLLRIGGMSSVKIAWHVGCSRQLVTRIGKRLGLISTTHVKSVYRPRRPEAEIRADLARQLEGVVRRFEASL